MKLSTLDQAELVRELMNTRDRIDAALEILCGDQEASTCQHPADAVEDVSTMDDDGEQYRCKRCGAGSPTPFPSIHAE